MIYIIKKSFVFHYDMFDKEKAKKEFSSLEPKDKYTKILSSLEIVKDIDPWYKNMIDHIVLLGKEYDINLMEDYFSILLDKMSLVEHSQYDKYLNNMDVISKNIEEKQKLREQEISDADYLLENL